MMPIFHCKVLCNRSGPRGVPSVSATDGGVERFSVPQGDKDNRSGLDNRPGLDTRSGLENWSGLENKFGLDKILTDVRSR